MQGRKAWEWVYIGEGAVLHVVAPSRAKREPEAVPAGARPEVWVADLFGSQQGHGERGQVCLAHQLRDVPFTNNKSERALRPSVIFRKVTNGTRSEWGAEFFAAVRSVIGTGRLHGLSPFEAIAQTIDGRRSILNPV